MDRQAVFLAALRVRHPDERAACLDQMCGTDVALRREVEELLQAHDRERAERAAPPAPIHHGARPSTRPSRGRVAVAQGALPRFADETTALLRKRLMILALAMGIIRTVGLLTILSYPGLWLRLLVAGVYVGTFFLTWSSRPLSYRQLRWLELACLGGFTIQAVYMPSHLILARARAGDFATVVMDQYFLLGAWSVHLMGYAFLIPNTWQRAAALLIPLGLLPYANFAFLEWYEPRVAEAFAAPHHGPPYLLPLVAVFYSICFTHVMHAIRRESFRASRFGQYVLLEKLGGGGMGVVYKAEHQLLKRPCAIKLIRPGSDLDADMLARFEQEVRITARLSHWNTVEIYDYGRTEDGQFYYVMELLRG
ncbi:MAG: hypothetical protein JNM56_09960, partial [Planctomycetia bacterium]|nr:hypothetical protein [Planctomycetia bacterium]